MLDFRVKYRTDEPARGYPYGAAVLSHPTFDRTVFWIDVPRDGVSIALGVLADAMMNSALPPDEYLKEQEVIRREFAMGFASMDSNTR